MKVKILKYFVLFILSLLPFVGNTNAVMSDVEESRGNYFAATSLDIQLQDVGGVEYLGPIFDEDKMVREAEEESVVVKNVGGMDVEYWVEFNFVQGAEEVCDGFEIVASRGEDVLHSGALSELDTATQAAQLEVEDSEEWKFVLSHENKEVDLQGETCEFDIDFVAFENAGTQVGFSDTEKLASSVTISYEALLEAEHNVADHEFSFVLSDLDHFQSFTYSLNYKTDTIDDEVSGVVDLSGEVSKQIDVLLGTCSDTCVYYSNPYNFELEVNLYGVDGYIYFLSAQL